MNEIRLIDANALKNALSSNFEICRFNVTYDGILAEIIDNAPTVELPNYGGKIVPDVLQGWKYEENSQGKCESCKYYYQYYEQFTHNPRGDGYCGIARMSPEGMTHINCSDDWYCADFCPNADMRGCE